MDVYDDAGRRVGRRTEWQEIDEADRYRMPVEEQVRRILFVIAVIVAVPVLWILLG